MKDVFSLIKWNYDLNSLSTGDEVLVIVKDDSGDNEYWYITSAWKPYHTNLFIKDNDYLIGEVQAWADMPKKEDLKVFE